MARSQLFRLFGLSGLSLVAAFFGLGCPPSDVANEITISGRDPARMVDIDNGVYSFKPDRDSPPDMFLVNFQTDELRNLPITCFGQDQYIQTAASTHWDFFAWPTRGCAPWVLSSNLAEGTRALVGGSRRLRPDNRLEDHNVGPGHYFFSVCGHDLASSAAKVTAYVWSGVGSGDRNYAIKQYTCDDPPPNSELSALKIPISTTGGELASDRSKVTEIVVSQSDDWTIFHLYTHVNFDYEFELSSITTDENNGGEGGFILRSSWPNMIWNSVPVRDIYIEGDLLYAADTKYGLAIYDVGDSADPKEVGSIDTSYYYYDYVTSVAKSGRYVFVGREGISDPALVVLDVNNPQEPAWVCQVRLNTEADPSETIQNLWDLEFKDDYLIGPGGISGSEFWVIDVSDAGQPFAEAREALPQNDGEEYWIHPRMAVVGDYAYVTGHQNGLIVVDLSDTRQPRYDSIIPTESRPTDACVLGDRLYVGLHYDGLKVFSLNSRGYAEVSRPADDALPVSVSVAGDKNHVALAGFAEDKGTIVLYDVSSGTPSVLDRFEGTVPSKILMRNSILYVAGGGVKHDKEYWIVEYDSAAW